jgi:hypothetical protein
MDQAGVPENWEEAHPTRARKLALIHTHLLQYSKDQIQYSLGYTMDLHGEITWLRQE